MSPEIKQIFDMYPLLTKQVLLTIRQWIFEVAENTNEVGKIKECLKWSEPSYVVHTPKSGTTLRLTKLKSSESEYGLYVHCQTTLIEEFRVVYPDLKYDKNRGVLFNSHEPIQTDAIKQFIYLALSYHSRKQQSALSSKSALFLITQHYDRV
jgi:hypothetical protein